eukprot:5215868-Amphidinium_carterae.2
MGSNECKGQVIGGQPTYIVSRLHGINLFLTIGKIWGIPQEHIVKPKFETCEFAKNEYTRSDSIARLRDFAMSINVLCDRCSA